MALVRERRPTDERGAWLGLLALVILSAVGGGALYVALKLLTWWLQGFDLPDGQ